MTENNNVEKARFFAQYWGQKIAMYKTDQAIKLTIGHPSVLMTDIDCIELIPLSNISDEDAVEVARIIHAWVSNNYESAYYDIPGFVEYLKEVFIEGFGSIGISGISNYIKAYQYLQSKGYLLPWRDLSVEELINRGWVKQKVK